MFIDRYGNYTLTFGPPSEIKMKVCKTRFCSHDDTRPNKKSISLEWNTFCVSMKGTGDEFTDQRLKVYTGGLCLTETFSKIDSRESPQKQIFPREELKLYRRDDLYLKNLYLNLIKHWITN